VAVQLAASREGLSSMELVKISMDNYISVTLMELFQDDESPNRLARKCLGIRHFHSINILKSTRETASVV
jgi:hypothetical protein